MRNLVLGAAGLIASLAANPAAAADVRFTLTNPVIPGSVTWLLPQSPAPDIFADDAHFALAGPILGTLTETWAGDGHVEFGVLFFPTHEFGGGFGAFGFIGFAASGPPEFDFPFDLQVGGPQLFTGPTEAPTFRLGTYALTDVCAYLCGGDLGDFTLTISAAAVPEPATWAMMILGFGGIGARVRARARRRAAGWRIRA
jgi:hypothetical protein